VTTCRTSVHKQVMPAVTRLPVVHGYRCDERNIITAQLQNAIKENKVASLYRLMYQHCPNVESVDPRPPHHTLLQVAVSCGHTNMVRAVLRYSANPRTTRGGSGEPVTIVSTTGQALTAQDIYTQLWNRYSHPTYDQYAIDSSSVVVAARHGHLLMVKFLIDECNLPHNAVLGGVSALRMAALHDHTDIVDYLKMVAHRHYKHVSARLILYSIYEQEPRHTLLMIPPEPTARFVADINTPNEDGDVAIVAAANSGYLDIVRALVGVCADVDQLACGRTSALQTAVANQSGPVVRYLVGQKASLYISENRSTVLHLAIQSDDPDILHMLLLASEINADTPDEKHMTPLACAILLNHLSCVKVLLDAKADPECATCGPDNTPLLLAVRESRLDVVELLLQLVATVPASVIHDAVSCSSLDVLTLIMKQPGVDINVYHSGLTPLLRAAHAGLVEPFSFLCEAGADFNCSTDSGLTVLMVAAVNNHHELIRYVLLQMELDIDVNYSLNGWKALDYAEHTNSTESVAALKQHTCNLAALPNASRDTVDSQYQQNMKKKKKQKKKKSKQRCANVTCSNGGKNACSKCQQVKYCTVVCQRKHWPTHQKECRLVYNATPELLFILDCDHVD
jgi:ankyrin repeat protein